jgi:hypothetical protein
MPLSLPQTKSEIAASKPEDSKGCAVWWQTLMHELDSSS